MRRLRVLATAAVLPVVVLGAAACTASGAGSSGTGPTSTVQSRASAPFPGPGLAGSTEARELAPLPTGAASGSAVLAYSGVGELRAPFRGRCSHGAGGTQVSGSADTAQITVEVTPGGGHVTLKDIGLAGTSDLTTGRYAVSGRHLSLAAHVAHDGQPIGTIQLEVDCGR